MGDWTFFSNHGHVLVCLAHDNEARLRDVAERVGITERAVQKIVRDLQDEGYLEVSKHGRRNRYRINNRKNLRHSLQAGCTVGQLLRLVTRQDQPEPELQAAVPTSEPAPEAIPDDSPVSQSEIPAGSPEPAGRAQDRPDESATEKESAELPDDGIERGKKTDKSDGSELEQGQLF